MYEQTVAKQGIVIVGAGLAAVRLSEQLRRGGYDGPLTIVGEEPHLPYDRPPLSKEALRDPSVDTTLKPAQFYADQNITLRLGSPAVGLDTATRVVRLADGTELGYDELIIATGLRPRRIPGFDLPGVHVLRFVDDKAALSADAAGARRAVVVGAGFIGCEVTASLRAMGLEVVLVEPAAQPLAGVLGEQIGALVARLHRAEGVDVRTGVGVRAVSGEDRVRAVTLGDGVEIDADLVVLGIGSTPATDWLEGSGVEVGDGVICDNVGRASAPHVWAAGDVAAWRDRDGVLARPEHWSNVAEQARVLVPAILGGQIPETVVVPFFWSDQYDVKLQSLGAMKDGDVVHVVDDDGRAFLAYYERDGILVGAVGAGIPGRVTKARGKIAAGVPIAEVIGPD
ncbi:hypothetical protein MBRU_05345 [Mycolicibacterium brumae DSM 44177]|nr:hypothetical protein MBRU_05345 [Mycolicibacterium brumae DSM 44177]